MNTKNNLIVVTYRKNPGQKRSQGVRRNLLIRAVGSPYWYAKLMGFEITNICDRTKTVGHSVVINYSRFA